MRKQQYAVIGNLVEYTMSPFIHERLFELAKVDAQYSAMNIKESELQDNVPLLNKLQGYNVTIPYKVSITKFLNRLDKKAEFYGAVNTVKNTKGVSTGYITDVYGFLKSLEVNGIKLGGRVVIIGAGGVAKVIAKELSVKGCNPTIAARSTSLSRAAQIAGNIKDTLVNMEVGTCLLDRLSGNIDLLINATPVGMYPQEDKCAVSDKIINSCKNVFDLVYNPTETLLMKKARANGANVVNGLSMLVWQAVYSQQIWNDVEFKYDDILQLFEDTKKYIEKKEKEVQK